MKMIAEYHKGHSGVCSTDGVDGVTVTLGWVSQTMCLRKSRVTGVAPVYPYPMIRMPTRETASHGGGGQ